MHSHHAAFFDFHQIVKAMDGLSERQQITTLKVELFHAIERGTDFRVRACELEERIAELQGKLDARDQEHDARVVRLTADLVRAIDEFAGLRTKMEKRLWGLRAALAGAKARCDALEETCQSLLLTIEQAGIDLAEEDTAPSADASESLA
jgi:predicted  nucleic acid-binding Zn-ribbon protein